MQASTRFNALQTSELLSHIKEGNQDAWREVYRRYKVFLSNAALRASGGSERDSDDVLQSAFLSAWKDLDGFAYRGEGSFRAWLERIVVHKELSKLRKQVRRADILAPRRLDTGLIRGLEDSAGRNPADSVLDQEAQRRLKLCMDEHLDDLAREIIALRHVEGLSTGQIADVVELTGEQVRRRYKAAMECLAGQLGKGDRDGV
ncbi:MAG: RNA polymerase sigma-70 factor (ECF subfamily) [Candidatus Paceibacteria bacterium]